MIKHLFLFLSLLPLAAFAQEKPFTVPEVAGWQAAGGYFLPQGRIVYGDKCCKPVAERLSADYKLLFDKELPVVKGNAKPGDICLGIEDARALGQEGYTLTVDHTAALSSPTVEGLFWATRTLLQLSETSEAHLLPKGSITDRPQYAHRGFMLDCGRKFIPMAYLRNLVRIMGYYKMNVLQIHLNDNGFKQYFGNRWETTQAAFRLESDTYPGLTAKDGSYTKQEFRELQKLAAENGVEIIPEIDVPAHSLAFTRYRPEIGSDKYGQDHLDLFKQATYDFVDGLFREYLGGENPVFTGKRVCIGTDEYSNADKDVIEAFRRFTDHYIKLVESFGKMAVVWGALTHAKGETPVKADGVVMNCWYNGYAQPKDMKELGYKLVSIPDGSVYIVPAAGYYYDYLNCQHLYDNWTPAHIGNVRFEEGDTAILGGMFAVWNDHPGNGISVKDIHHRVMPALQTLSAKCWSGAQTSVPYAAFNEQRLRLSEAPGVNELGRIGKPRSEVLALAELRAGDRLGMEEIGYDYSVSFTIEGQKEEPGAKLLSSDNAVFYLSDPQNGCLAFERDGYLNRFDYRIPAGRKVEITVQGNNKMTRLLVDGQVRQTLDRLTLYAVGRQELFDKETQKPSTYELSVYNPSQKMYYVSTLVFPLRQAGTFRSKVTNLRVFNYIP